VLDHTIVVPYNDLPALEAALKAHKDRIAAVIVEPMPGGAGDIPSLPGYLVGVRELTRKYGVLMIADEIITLRLSLGGAQKLYGFDADLTTVGKFIGGGFPVGAFGGRKDLMSQFDPRQPNFLAQSGTFNGNNVSMAAGIANMKHFDEDTVKQHNALGARMRKGFNDAFLEVGICGQMTGVGPMGTVHWTDGAIVNAYQSAVALRDAGELPKLVHLAMLNRGVFIPMRSQYAVSTPMSDAQVDFAIEAFVDALRDLKSVVAEIAPQLIK
jgi:glutamate-1-semialdehyde 2,1-aminomutase